MASNRALEALKDPFATDYPTLLEATMHAPELDPAKVRGSSGSSGSDGGKGGGAIGKKRARKGGALVEVALCGAFSDTGSYLALGSFYSGRVVIRDMVTRSVAAVHKCHDATVCSVSFVPGSRSRKLLTASADGTCKVFDLDGFRCVWSARFERAVAGASVCVRESSSGGGEAVPRCLVGFSEQLAARGGGGSASEGEAGGQKEEEPPWPVLFDLVGPSSDSSSCSSSSAAGAEPVAPKAASELGNLVTLKWEMDAKDRARAKCLVATFSADGKHAFVGGLGGVIHVFDGQSGALLSSQGVLKKKGLVRSMSVGKNGRVMLVQVDAKEVHMLGIGSDDRGEPVLSPSLDFRDPVEGTAFSAFTLSPDCEYVAATGKSQLQLWNILGRAMVKLRSPSGGLTRDVLWHPGRPLVACLGNDGQVDLWAAHKTESWTAFAPNFVPLEDSIEYHEREDEFDRNPSSLDPGGNEALANGANRFDEDQEVDVVTLQQSDDPAKQDFALPFLPEALAILKDE